MGARRKGRELAVQALYQVDLLGDASATSLRAFFAHVEAGGPAKAFAADLVDGVLGQRERIDDLIGGATEHWRVERLSTVDLAVLRVATCELLRATVPTNIVLDEAIEIARRFGSAESAAFVNGVLDQIAARLGVKAQPYERTERSDNDDD